MLLLRFFPECKKHHTTFTVGLPGKVLRNMILFIPNHLTGQPVVPNLKPNSTLSAITGKVELVNTIQEEPT